jgi:subtilisin family serine protease
MTSRTLRVAAWAAIACLATWAAGPAVGESSGSSEPAWRDKVHPRVLQDAEAGPVEFLAMLDEQADLGPARYLTGKAARGRFVFDTLREVAQRTQAPLLATLDATGAEYRPFWIANMVWVRGSRAVLETVAERAEVRRIDPNPAVAAAPPVATPASDLEAPAGIEWGIQKTMADQVWALGYRGSGIVIGGQDTGYDWDHPAIVGKYRGWNGTSASHAYNWHDSIHTGGGSCGDDSPFPCDDHGHGTHTMGTMVGDDGGANQVGMAPEARWIGCRNMDQGVGTPATYAECFQWFVAPTNLNGQNPDTALAPHVINNSWGCPPSEGCSFDALKTVVVNTRAAGIVVVVSAGNAGSGCSTVVDPPAIYDAAFSVGATDSSDTIASFSSRGPVTIDGSNRLKPNVSAPGVNVRSCVPGGGYGFSSGTSMAGPHVAGLVALLLDARPDLDGNVEVVETLIERAALPRTSGQTCGGMPGTQVPNPVYGWGRVDALETLLGDPDDDGTSNLDDCRPVDPLVWAAPSGSPVMLLDQQGIDTVFSWTLDGPAGASVPRYDLMRSPAASDFTDPDCLLVNSTGSSALDDDVPATIFYYLIRIKNDCGSSLGTRSDGSPRTAPACLSIGG